MFSVWFFFRHNIILKQTGVILWSSDMSNKVRSCVCFLCCRNKNKKIQHVYWFILVDFTLYHMLKKFSKYFPSFELFIIEFGDCGESLILSSAIIQMPTNIIKYLKRIRRIKQALFFLFVPTSFYSCLNFFNKLYSIFYISLSQWNERVSKIIQMKNWIMNDYQH